MQAELVAGKDQFSLIREYWVPTPQGNIYAKSWQPLDGGMGNVAPIVLFHDSLGCVELWRDFPEMLAAATRRRVIAYDRLGFGRSWPHPGGWNTQFIHTEAKQYFPLVCAALGVEHFVVLGHSVGGAMAVCCAALNPDNCEAVITLAAPAFVDAGMVRGLLSAQQAFSEAGQIERLARYHGDKAKWVLSAWLDTWLSTDFATWRIEQIAPGLSRSLLVIHGDQDEYGSLEYPRHIATLTTGPSKQVIIPGCHHLPHREAPEVVLAAVSRFLNPSY